MSLKNRIAIVTGAGGGLGAAHARLLAQRGACVLINDMNEDAAEAIAQSISHEGGSALAHAASVTDETAVSEMINAAMSEWGRIDILVNNAGILRDKSFAKMDIDDFRLVVDVHLMGAAICTKAVWEIMRAQNYGRIVMTTSSSGLYGSFGQANYGAAKMALVGLMQTLSLEGEKYNIRVNCLAPTAATQMTDGILSPEALVALAPDRVSPGLIALVEETAPTRTILCAGAGHFATANITLTTGHFAGAGPEAAEQIQSNWEKVTDRSGEVVPGYGLTQSEYELSSFERANKNN